MKKFRRIISLTLMTAVICTFSGCKSASTKSGESATPTEKTLKHVNIGYFGNTCEAAVFAAYEKGFFKEEGLDVTMVKGDANTLKDSLATGKVDATDGLFIQWMKPIESGLNIKYTAAIHTGCIQVLVSKNSNIKSFKDLKGKKIGVPAIGGGPMVLASRLLTDQGIDSQKGVEWKVYPNSELPIALDKGEVDVIAVADPFAQIQVNSGKAKAIYNSATDEPFKSEYCCATVINGKLIEKDPETAAAITRAELKGSKWVSKNIKEIAQIEIDKKYVPGDAATNEQVLNTYNFNPSVDEAQKAVKQLAKEMKNIGILNKDTDSDSLAKTSFVKLKGVN
ncbi:MAG: ABC transporter substrate-binding protein [Bacillota bacterium]|nr:ABC transporter substrate-binding protein [Bacillota bacterium]